MQKKQGVMRNTVKQKHRTPERRKNMKTIIKNGTIVTDEDIFTGDVLIDGEKIAEIGPGLTAQDAQVVDATGKLVFPGFIDAHTHFDLPVSGTVTADDFESGSACALLGGTTCVVDFATQDFGESLATALKNWHEKADGKASCDYAFHMAISQWTPEVRKEMADMVAQGIPSFKIYMTYGNRVSDEEIYEILTAAKELGALVCVHCENHGIIQARIRELSAEGRSAPAGHPLARLQAFLDGWLRNHPEARIDYIHGETALRGLINRPDALGLMPRPFDKSELFAAIRRHGVLPRKTFSMGEATEKRYYMEARGIQ
jgi:hypothetical protein